MQGLQLLSRSLLLVVAFLAGTIVSLGLPEVNVSLSHVSTLYFPTFDQNGSPTYVFPSSVLEQLALLPSSKLIYCVGQGGIYVIDASDVSNLTIKSHVSVAGDLDLTDVEVCGETVFVSYQNTSDKLQGGVLVYAAHDAESGPMTLLRNIPVGSLPDMIKPTSNCTLVVALENEGFVQEGNFYDPPGGVAIIRFPSGVDGEPEVNILNFTKFNAQFEDLATSGVRWVFRENGNNFSDNVEPEYVAFSHDYSKAYIGLQENNAIAVVDLTTDTITGIFGLGFKSWGELDPSDKDRDARIADSVDNDLRLALQDGTKLGRLTFSNVDGKNSEGKFERFYTYGGRGISIWRASDMERVFDSGSDMEKELAKKRPDVFNSNAKDADSLLSDSMDIRSDNKGPETESLTTGVVEGHLLIFAGNERPGNIAVYSVAPGGMRPQFQTLFTEGIPPGRANSTWQQLYDSRELYAIDPEAILFVPASQGLADFPLLLVGGSVSGTLSVLKVEVEQAPDHGGPSDSAVKGVVSPAAWTLATIFVVYLNGQRIDG